MKKTEEMVLISLLAILITLSGSFKIPSPFSGAEFQLSAPLAVAIAATFGIKRYLIAGILSSTLTLILGTHTILNVLVAMVFRIVVGSILYFFKPKTIPIILSGPIGSICARLVLWLFLGKAFFPMLLASIPGMIFTALLVLPLTKTLSKIKSLTL